MRAEAMILAMLAMTGPAAAVDRITAAVRWHFCRAEGIRTH
jgi:hypothetical protein